MTDLKLGVDRLVSLQNQFNHYLKQTCKNKYDHALLQKALGKLCNLIQDKGAILLWRSIFFLSFCYNIESQY